MTIELLINYISNLVEISSNDIRLLINYFKVANFSKGTILEKEGTIAQNLYFITNGFVRAFSIEDGIEITTQITGKNNFITAFNSFVTEIKSTENIQCVSDCKVLYITKSEYEILTKESEIWNSVCKRVYEKTITHNQQRTTDLLTLSAEKRYLKLLTDHPEIIQHVPIQMVASYIGIKPESLSRIRKKIIS